MKKLYLTKPTYADSTQIKITRTNSNNNKFTTNAFRDNSASPPIKPIDDVMVKSHQ